MLKVMAILLAMLAAVTVVVAIALDLSMWTALKAVLIVSLTPIAGLLVLVMLPAPIIIRAVAGSATTVILMVLGLRAIGVM
jgi:hypothetical protein